MNRAVFIMVAVGTIVTAGCESGIEVEVDQELTLTRVGQQSVPALVAVAQIDGESCTLELTEGRLLLRPDGRFELNTQGREVCVSNGSSDSNDDSNTVSGTYTLQGQTLQLVSESDFQIADHTFTIVSASTSSGGATIQVARTEAPFIASATMVFVRSD